MPLTRTAICSGGYAGVDELLSQPLVGLGVVSTLGLGLQQRDGADVPASLRLGVAGHELELAPQQDGILHDLALALAAVDDYGQLHHLLVLELPRGHAGDDVRPLSRRRGELQDEAGVEVAQYLERQAALRVVRLVHHNDGVRACEGRDERRVVGALDVAGLPGPSLVLRELRERRVLREGAAPVLVLKGVVRKDEHGELVLDGRAAEGAPPKAVLLVQDLDPVGEVAVERHAQGVRGVAQLPERLLQDFLARHEPDHGVRGAVRKLLADDVQGVGGDVRLAAPGGHLDADLGRAAKVVRVALDAVSADHQAIVSEVSVVRSCRVPTARVVTEIRAEALQHIALIVLEFHFYILAICRGICLKRTPSLSSVASSSTHLSAYMTVEPPRRGSLPRRS